MALRFLTAGESHGKALVGILEGVPAGLSLSAKEDLQPELARRKLGRGRGNRQKIETDAVEILSGVRRGRTIGSPIALSITNLDFKNWTGIMGVEPTDAQAPRRVEVPRPGHADLVGKLKYGFDDMRDVLERASARETAMRVALAAAARRLLDELDVRVGSWTCEPNSSEARQPSPSSTALIAGILASARASSPSRRRSACV